MFFMETVSLNDETRASTSSTSSCSTVLDVESLETELTLPEITVSIVDSENDPNDNRQCNHDTRKIQSKSSLNSHMNKNNGKELIMLDVNRQHKDNNGFSNQSTNHHRHVLPPLRVLTQKLPVEEGEYVDPTLFSPELSSHAMEVAHRRAKAIATEVKEMMELEVTVTSATKAKLSPAEAVGIIGGAFASSLKRAKKLMKPGIKEYDLLSGTSPSGETPKLDDLDTDGDGLQLSPDATYNEGEHFRTTKLKPVLKRISVYSTAAALEPEKNLSTQPQKKKRIKWHEDVLDADEEFCEEDTDGQEARSLMNAEDDAVGSPRSQLLNYSSKNSGQVTPRSRKKRKKLVRSLMRRLTTREKEELYRQRPDLMIVPNWAQKYREELAGADSTRWNAWLLAFIMILAVLLLVFILFIVRQRIAAAK